MRTATSNLFRRRQRNAARGQQASYRVTTPAPIEGWNTRDGANELKPTECFELINLLPTVGGLLLRPGYSSYSEGDTNPIKSLLVWSSGTEEMLIKATDSALTEISTGATATGFLAGHWQGQMMNDRLGMVNGTDSPQVFDGVSFSAMSITGPSSPNRLVGIKVFKSRSYFWDDTLAFWYSQPNALGGTLTKFPLTTVAQKGGRVLSINAWTQDGGAGPDDYLVVTTTKGEVIVYAGSNPSDANDWALVGRYYISEPIAQRGFLELDGKIHVLTKNDLETLPDRFTRQSQPSSKLSGAIREAYQAKPNDPKWGVYFDAKRQLVVINVPTRNGGSQQYVLAARGATRFRDIQAYHWVMFRGEMHWCGLGKSANYLLVNNIDLLLWSLNPLDLLTWTDAPYTTNYHVWRMGGSKDNDDFITFEARTGYSPLRSNNEKRVSMYRPLMTASGYVTMATSLAFDYSGRYVGEQAFLQSATSGTEWGSDWGSEWTAVDQTRGDWSVGQGTGQTVSLRCRGMSMVPLQWAQTDWEVVSGGRY